MSKTNQNLVSVQECTKNTVAPFGSFKRPDEHERSPFSKDLAGHRERENEQHGIVCEWERERERIYIYI